MMDSYRNICEPLLIFIMVKILDVRQQTAECIFMSFTQVIVFTTSVKIVFAVERNTFEKCFCQ